MLWRGVDALFSWFCWTRHAYFSRDAAIRVACLLLYLPGLLLPGTMAVSLSLHFSAPVYAFGVCDRESRHSPTYACLSCGSVPLT
jgi:hypothetical protein